MDLTTVVAIDASYDAGAAQWNVEFHAKDGERVLFLVDFDHADARSARDLDWVTSLLRLLGLRLTPGCTWRSDAPGHWTVPVRPAISAAPHRASRLRTHAELV
ncbi:hypothetical protein GCM10027568_29250 [Humibacter soli]